MLKAFTPTVTLSLLWLSGIEVPSRRVTLSVAGICVGTSLASLGEGSVTVIGLLIMLSAEVSEAVRLVLAQKLLKNLKMGVRPTTLPRVLLLPRSLVHTLPWRLLSVVGAAWEPIRAARSAGSWWLAPRGATAHICTHGGGATCPSRAGPLMGPPPELGRRAQIRARDDAMPRADTRPPVRISRRWWRVSIGWHRSPPYASFPRPRSWSCRAS